MPGSHSSARANPEPSRRRLALVLAGIVALVVAATAVGLFRLWPSEGDVASQVDPYSGPGSSIVSATVTHVEPFDCGDSKVGPDQLPASAGPCGKVTIEVENGAKGTVDVVPAVYSQGIEPGDELRVNQLKSADSAKVSYSFLDFERGLPLSVLVLAFAALTIVVARWRGLFALLGVGVTLVVLLKFILPALLAGQNPLAVAVTGSVAIMLVVLYLAHGISIRTTSALFGTLTGLAITAVLGIGATDWARLTGLGNEDDQVLRAVAGQIDLSGVIAASMVIAGLGVLNDVTVTQASAVWELRAAQPGLPGRDVFASAMRIGRDHIASSVYTLVFAYAGSAMTILLLIVAYQRSLLEIAGTEQIGAEIARTMVGAIGLVLAVPLTTAFAVLLAPKVDVNPAGPA